MKNRWFFRGLIVVLFACLFSSSSMGQSTLTGTSLNGRGWKILNEGKVVYLMGMEDGFLPGFRDANTEATYAQFKSAFDNLFATNLNRNEIISEIDRFYEEGANSPIPVYEAVRWVTQKAKGASVTELENRISVLRKNYSK